MHVNVSISITVPFLINVNYYVLIAMPTLRPLMSGQSYSLRVTPSSFSIWPDESLAS